MNRDDQQRIKLKVKTNTGINILCTAIRSQKVSEWLPHFEQAYREIKEDQGDDYNSIQRFIKALRIKKGNFHIANSETIGDIFDDNDEVNCEIVDPLSKKTRSDLKQKEDAEDNSRSSSLERDEAIIADLSRPKKKVKESIEKKSQEKNQNLKIQELKPKSKKQKKQNKEQTQELDVNKSIMNPTKKQGILNKVDLAKLKSLITQKNTKNTTIKPKSIQIRQESSNEE